VVLINDARPFSGTNDHPAIEEIRAMIETIGKKFNFETKDDIIRIRK